MKDKRIFHKVWLTLITVICFVIISLVTHIPGQVTEIKFIYPDAQSYMRAARYLYTQHFFADPVRPFGYPAIVGIPYMFGAADATVIWFGIFINFIFLLLSVYVIYDIISSYAPRAAFAMTLLFIFSFSNLLMVYQLMTEIFFIFILLLVAANLLKYLQSGKERNLWIGIGALCYSVIVRPICLYFALMALLIYLLLYIRKRNFKGIAFIILVYVATIGLQSANMYRCYGRYTLSFIQNYTLYKYLIVKAQYLQQGRPGKFGDFYELKDKQYNELLAPYASPDNIKQYWYVSDDYTKQEVTKTMKESKSAVLKSYLYNVVENARSGCGVLEVLRTNDKKLPAVKMLAAATKYQNILFTLMLLLLTPVVFLYGVIKYKRLSRVYLFPVIILIMTSYIVLTAGISFWQADRFNFVCYPFFILSALFFINTIANNRRHSIDR